MAQGRASQRRNPITVILLIILLVGFFVFIFSSPESSTPARIRHGAQDAASNMLSPASLPFRRYKKPQVNAPAPPVVHYRLGNITASSDPIANRESVLILTPLARFYPEYWANLLELSFPHELISLGFIIPKDAAGNVACKALQEQVAKTQAGPSAQRFASVTIMRQDFEPPLASQLESERHKMSNQKARRAAMSKARNSLLFTTLGPTTAWVLWLDSDIVETPATLLQDLARHDKPIIVPNCYQRFFDKDKDAMDVRPYDYNSWIDSSTAQTLASKMDKDEILLEGYAEMATYRGLMAFMSDGGNKDREIQLDGVGGTALLVKADVHRDGAMFPPFAFYHLIETEGFAKMAHRLGWQSWGLPNYFVSIAMPHFEDEANADIFRSTITTSREDILLHFMYDACDISHDDRISKE